MQPRPQSSSANLDVTSPAKLVGEVRLGRLAINGKSNMAEPVQRLNFSQLLEELKNASDLGWDSFIHVCQQTREVIGDFLFKDYEAHVVFESEKQFQSEYRRTLNDRGCKTDELWQKVLKQVQDEIQRRQMIGRDSQERKKIIAANYKPLHPHVYILKESFLADSFLSLVHYARDSMEATAAGLLSMVKQCDGKYAFLHLKPLL
ncbi:hypothetical protein ACROYT_G009752 [Oculina patagonica]